MLHTSHGPPSSSNACPSPPISLSTSSLCLVLPMSHISLLPFFFSPTLYLPPCRSAWAMACSGMSPLSSTTYLSLTPQLISYSCSKTNWCLCILSTIPDDTNDISMTHKHSHFVHLPHIVILPSYKESATTHIQTQVYCTECPPLTRALTAGTSTGQTSMVLPYLSTNQTAQSSACTVSLRSTSMLHATTAQC
jgi:hypothetical protein